MTIRRKFSQEFKLDAISLVKDQGYSRAEASRSLSIHPNMLSRWIKEHESDQGNAFRGNGKLTAEQLEIRQLREENRRLKMEKENFKKGGGLLCSGNEVKYSFIAQHEKVWPIDKMCLLLGVLRSGYYRYRRNRHGKPSDPLHQEMIDFVKDIAEKSTYTFGSRRMRKALNALGYPVGRRKTQSLMKEAGVMVRYRKKYKITTNSRHKKPVFENVLSRDFSPSAPDRAYVSDITYLSTQEGWLYLTVVIDLFSRKVVGWSMSSRMKADLVCDALKMALWQRKPKPGLIVHSDRGSQYASNEYRKLLNDWKCTGSMSRKGDCWDNAVAESFFGSLKQERVQWKHYQTRSEAHRDVLNYITVFYNDFRLHSTIGYISPNQFEKEMRSLKMVA
ncbi:IS3 family transposase [Legionella israelensis]|uniref:IS3 family transposase n=1 Tax=Legionella israelensis TaxID=454 RepID=UPI001073BEDD|nr:IS3 family transposase [Legionella israelensis]QBS09004.1 IS3 family transposase [Legionella israelensis]